MGAKITKNGQAVDSMELRTNNGSTSLVTVEYSAVGNTVFDKIIEILTVGLLVFMPAAFGAVQAWSQELVIIASGLIAVVFCCKLIVCPHQRIVRTWAYVPVVLFILIAALQLVPLPKAVVSIISPNTAALRTEFLGNIPGNDSYLKWMPLSLYPAATKHDLRLVLSASVIFLVVLNVFRRPEQIKRLLWSIAIIGGLVASITLAQNIFGNGKIYWFIFTPNSQGYSGPFINHSNYGQFVNLSIAAALGALIVHLHEVFSRSRASVPEVFDYIGSSAARGIWLLIGIISICFATVFLSLTRGGIISMLAATAFTAVVMARTKTIKRQWWMFVLICILAFSCILYTGFDAVYDRLVTLRNFSNLSIGRIQILKDIAESWSKFPLLGTGLGTHRYVYPMFDQSYIVPLAAHAENEYAQVLEETGLLGLGTLLVFGIMISRQYLKSIRNKNNVICLAVYGLGFGIIAILIHSMSDFGQHIPTNGFLTTIFCAIILVLGSRETNREKPQKATVSAGHHRWLHLTATIFISLIVFRAVRDADKYRIAEGYWNRAQAIREQLDKTKWQGTEYQYIRLIQNAQTAVDSDPENIHYRYWTNVYRYKRLVRNSDPYNEEAIINDKQIPKVHEIVSQLHRVCMLCPTYGPAYSMLGQIEKFVLNDEEGTEQIKKGYRLAKNDPVVCFVAGSSDASEGDIDSAVREFARAIKLDGRLYKKVASIYIDQLSRPDLAITAAGRNPEHLYQVYLTLNENQYVDYAQQVIHRLTEVLEDRCSQENTKAWEYKRLGECYKIQGRNELAIKYYRRALRLQYNQVSWRFELASLLANCDNAKEAINEVRVCLQLKPEFTAAKKLLADCSVNPSVLKENIEQD